MSGSLVDVAEALGRAVATLRFASPVSHVYNPLVYAFEAHAAYLDRYGRGHKPVLLVGMNPGPFGMVQTGVPFGDVGIVRDFLRIDHGVVPPEVQHPRRPILGFSVERREVSGQRLWGWLRDRFGDPDRMAEHVLVVNYCPLAFLEASGKNRTPDKLPRAERAALEAECDQALRQTVASTSANLVIGVGRFAFERVAAALASATIRVGQLPHPSPASPVANRGWSRLADEAMARMGVVL